MVFAFTIQETSNVCFRSDDTRIDDLLSGRSKILGLEILVPIFLIARKYTGTKSEGRAHQMTRRLQSTGFTPQKIRAELPSNGSCWSRRALELMDAGSL